MGKVVLVAMLAIAVLAAACATPTVEPTKAPAATAAAVQPIAIPTEKPQCKELTRITLATGAPNVDTPFGWYTSVPDLMGFFAEECLKVQVIPMGGVEASTQAVAVGRAEIAVSTPVALLGLRAKGADLVSVYGMFTRNIYTPTVLDDSPYRKVEDLAGKTIGLHSLVAGTDTMLNLMYKQLGYTEPVKVVDVGLGAGALQALQSGRVQALMMTESTTAGFITQGAKLREIRHPILDQLTWAAIFAVRRDYLEAHRDIVVGYLRAVAKGTVFSLTNPDAAIDIHWQAYPYTAPLDAAKAPEKLAQQAMALKVGRLTSIDPAIAAGRVDKRFGFQPPNDVLVYRDFLVTGGTLDKSSSVEGAYTNELLDAVNKFDRSAVEALARSYKMRY